MSHYSTMKAGFYGRTFRSDSPMTLDQIQQYAPSVLAETAHESRGKRYAFIPTLDVLRGMQKEGFEVFAVAQTKVRDESKHDFTKHMVRMRHPDSGAMRLNEEIPEIVLVNSHDGTSSYQIMAGYFRLVCTNGLICGTIDREVRIRHSGNVIHDVIDASFATIDHFRDTNEHIGEYKQIGLNRNEQFLLAHTAQQLRWGDDEKAPVTAENLLRPKRHADMKDDLWTTFNRIQENIIKGGVVGHSATGRNMTTRAVNGVNENVRLNKALWTLTQHMAALKTGQEPVLTDVLEMETP